ncbi:MCE family protein [Gordonia aichiensis]|uniref:Mce family protein n=1 Tax=Gordonia aichiensis NBRC 108223 TaxID=1220583 RepID=L7KKM3_9ACTN|nr:MCE family protein [Gordonia aichiensis]GAC49164.1 Mce family protein [Gordonia aichiensis NBRC 108223]
MRMGATLAKLGVFVVITLLSGAFVAVLAGNLRFGPSQDYKAVFSSASGIREGSEVRIAGVPVGSVSKVSLDGRDGAIVEFSVDKSHRLYHGTEVAIRYKNLIGDRFVELRQGTGDMSTLQPGETIPASQTTPALDIDQVVNGFRPLLTGLDPDQTNRLATSLIAVLNGQETAISSLISELTPMTTAIADRDEAIGQIISNFNDVLRTINDRHDRFDSLIDGLADLVRGLSADRDSISRSLVKVDGLTAALGDVVTSVRPDLAASIANLGTLSQNLNSQADTLQLVLNKLPETYRLTTRASSYGSFVNFFVCGMAIKYGAGRADQTPMFTSPAARCQP